MTYTPEQLRDQADKIAGSNGPSLSIAEQVKLLANHADTLEELAGVRDELLGVKEYREKNPLGGPAKVFDAMADQIRAGEDFNKVIADYGWCPAERAERAEAALADHERWLDEMVSDYRLDADPHTASKRLAINSLIHEQRTALAESERKGERGCFCLMEMMQAYERRVRSLCSPEEIEKRPWECAEYNKAAEYLRAVWKPDAYRAEFKE